MNRLANAQASIARLIAGGGTLALLATTAVGCGHHHPSATGDHTTTEAKSNTPHSTASSTTNTPATPGGTFVGRCPKVIAATCVPGIRYERGPNVICVNRHGNKATARTPTPQDLARLKKQAPEAEREFAEDPQTAVRADPPTLATVHPTAPERQLLRDLRVGRKHARHRRRERRKLLTPIVILHRKSTEDA